MTSMPAPQDAFYAEPEPDLAPEAAVEITSPAAVVRLTERPDVVRVKGVYALVNTSLTPHQAMVEDLLFVRRVLDQAQIPYLLVRGNDARPVMAVNWEQRDELRAALVAACADEPFYSLTMDAKKKTARLVADGELCRRRPDACHPAVPPADRAHRRAAVRPGHRRAGGAVALGQRADPPADRELADPPHAAGRGGGPRRGGALRAPLADHREHVRRPCHGHRLRRSTWSSPGSTATTASSSSTGTAHGRATSWARATTPSALPPDRRAAATRCARSTCSRRGCAASSSRTDSPRAGLAGASTRRSTIVRSEEFFARHRPCCRPTTRTPSRRSCTTSRASPSTSCTPTTTCSSAGRSARSMFFSPGGITKFVEADTRIGLGDTTPDRSGFENAARVNRKLLLRPLRPDDHPAPGALRGAAAQSVMRSWSRSSPRTSPAPRQPASAPRPTSR